MNPSVRSLSAILAGLMVAAAYFVVQASIERPAPPRPAPTLSAARPAVLPVAPPTARDILDQSVALDLRGEQIARLKALDRLSTREIGALETTIREALQEFSGFVAEAQAKQGASLQEIQRRSGETSRLSEELRERRQHHSEAALRVLADWQRRRLAEATRPVTERRTDESARH